MEYIFIVFLFVIVVILAITGFLIGLPTDTEGRKARGEPKRAKEAKQQKSLEVEKLTRALKEKLLQDETVVVAVKGLVDTLILTEVMSPPGMAGLPSYHKEKPITHGEGIFAATDRRLIMFQKKSNGDNFRVLGYDTISAVETKRSWVAGASIIITSDMKMRITGIYEQDEAVEQFTGYVREKQAKDAKPSPSEPTTDIVNQIRGLAELKDQGILTEEEFNTKKRNLLDRL